MKQTQIPFKEVQPLIDHLGHGPNYEPEENLSKEYLNILRWVSGTEESLPFFGTLLSKALVYLQEVFSEDMTEDDLFQEVAKKCKQAHQHCMGDLDHIELLTATALAAYLIRLGGVPIEVDLNMVALTANALNYPESTLERSKTPYIDLSDDIFELGKTFPLPI